MDTELRYLLVNPALERTNGVPAADHIGRRPRDVLSFSGIDTIESALRQVLVTGTPLLDQYIVGGAPRPIRTMITPGRCRTTGSKRPTGG